MRSRTVACVALTLVAGAAVAQQIPLSNWTVPPYRVGGASGGYSTMADISPGVAFVAVQPCRIVDTRGGGVFTGAYGPPNMAAGATRTFDLNSAPHCTGIPAGVDAYSLNFTVTQTAGPLGDIRAWPTSNPPIQLTSVLNWTVTGATLANATIIPAGINGAIDVQVAGSGTHLLIDINGYFSDQLGGNQFEVRSGGGVAIFGENTDSGYGVWGISANGFGVVGGGGAGGVWATTAGSGSGVYGQNTSTGAGYGVYGRATNGTGVLGETATTATNTAGVLGRDGGGPVPFAPSGPSTSAGVRGEAAGGRWGVLGLAGHDGAVGVTGYFLNATGTPLSGGILGLTSTTGVYFQNGLSGVGTKSFIEPHPTDPSKVIKYVSLEGNEAGTYFRGRGKFQNGVAVIDVPEDFRMVTDSEGLSIQVTPIGQMATVAVESIGLDRIVVRGSRNVEFFYTVNGERRAYKNVPVIVENEKFFAPESASAAIPLWVSEDERQRLITNGTYRADGTVNMETARRLGWDKEWEKRARPVPEAVSD